MLGFMVILIIIAAIAYCVYVSRKRDEVIISQTNTNIEYEDALKWKGFTVSKSYYLGGNAIFVDNVNKKWSVKNSLNASATIYQFSDLLSFELFEDDQSVIKGTKGNALVGGFLFGATGAVIGSSSKRAITQYCNNIRMRITVNNLQNPVIEVHLVAGPIDKNSQEYHNFISKSNEFVGILSYIQTNASKDSEDGLIQK